MVNSVVNKVFLMKVYKMIKYFIQYIFLGFVFYITASAVHGLIGVQNSFLKSTLVWITFLILFSELIIANLKMDKLFGKYTVYVKFLLVIGTIIILFNTLGIPEITFH